MAGEPLGPECFPEDIWVAPHADRGYAKLPDLFFAGSHWAVSKGAAEVMRQFDLGGGAVYPVGVFGKDRRTPIGEGWFCLNFGNQKQAFVPELTPKARQISGRQWYQLSPTMKDGGVTVTNVALSGADIWIDPQVVDAFFLSDRLARALKKAKAAREFFLVKCCVTAV